MEYLYKGTKQYLENVYPGTKDHLQTLSEGQKPHTLLLTCSDSRINVNDFTQTKPGDVFVIRNAGNVLPTYDANNPSNEALTLEYGVQVLGVKEIVVCGHVKCGAMQGIKDLPKLKELPLIHKGLERIASQFKQSNIQDLPLDDLILANVKQQITHLLDYPFVKEKVQQGELNLWGWVYDFVSGEIVQKVSHKELL